MSLSIIAHNRKKTAQFYLSASFGLANPGVSVPGYIHTHRAGDGTPKIRREIDGCGQMANHDMLLNTKPRPSTGHSCRLQDPGANLTSNVSRHSQKRRAEAARKAQPLRYGLNFHSPGWYAIYFRFRIMMGEASLNDVSSNIARECRVSRKIVENCLSVIKDLLIAHRLPVFTKRARRAMTAQPKFYLFDAGVYHHLRPQGPLDSPDDISGVALEGLVRLLQGAGGLLFLAVSRRGGGGFRLVWRGYLSGH